MKKFGLVISLFFVLYPTLFSQSVGLEIGNIAPEIKLPNPQGDTITLSSL